MSAEAVGINNGGQVITKYIFKVDGCLDVKQLAESVEEALMMVKRLWPRSTIKYLREEFSHKSDPGISFSSRYSGIGEVRKGKNKSPHVSRQTSTPKTSSVMSLEDVINNELN